MIDRDKVPGPPLSLLSCSWGRKERGHRLWVILGCAIPESKVPWAPLSLISPSLSAQLLMGENGGGGTLFGGYWGVSYLKARFICSFAVY